MATWIWILIIIVAVVIVAGVTMAARQRRTAALRQRFGPEYDRAVEARDDQRLAESDLRNRQKQRAMLDIRPLPADQRARFADEWREVQERFVDQPTEALVDAHLLVHRVMEARGYPIRDFEAQADLISVDHPNVVENYRVAHGIHQRAQEQQASTEDLREALLRYRSLFSELLDGGASKTDAAQRATTDSGVDRHATDQDVAGEPDMASRRDGGAS